MIETITEKLKDAGYWMRENFTDDPKENIVWVAIGFVLCGILWLLVG